MNRQSLTEKAQSLVRKSTAAKLKICAAESCTGGLVASSIVSISGASAIFAGSAVCYQDSAKRDILGVRASTLEKNFAESAVCAREMAQGALKIFGADIAAATTGFLDANVAPKPENLAGTVFICVCRKDENAEISFVERKILLDPSDERNENRAKITEITLNLILSQIQ